MARGRVWAIVFSLLLLLQGRPVLAAPPDLLKDTLSDSRLSASSRHTLIVDMTAGTAFQTSETFTITFAAGFSVPAFSASDVTFDDGTARTVLSSCAAGVNNVGLAVAGQVVTLTACAGFNASSNGATVTIVLGTGSTLITNPSSPGIASVTVAGSYGDDSRVTSVAIIEGVTVSLTIPASSGDVRFTGDAFPAAMVTILDNNSVAGTTTANGSSVFDKTIQGLTPGVHTFGIFGQSLDNRKTLTLSFNINVISGSTVTVSGILLPVIFTVPESHKRPAVLSESGLAKNGGTVTTITQSDPITKQTTVDSNGNWSVQISDILRIGTHSATALVNDNSGNQSIQTTQSFQVVLSADLNVDEFVNLTDFSILMFNYGTSSPPNKAADINDNGPVDLVDFSVMMFYWSR